MIIDSLDYPGGYIIIGKDRNGKKFRIKRGQFDLRYVFAINLWNGNIWGIKKDGKRKLLKSVRN